MWFWRLLVPSCGTVFFLVRVLIPILFCQDKNPPLHITASFRPGKLISSDGISAGRRSFAELNLARAGGIQTGYFMKCKPSFARRPGLALCPDMRRLPG